MSGPFCGGCGEGDLLAHPSGAGKRPVVCDLCGWTADGAELPSPWMEDDIPWTKRERKKAGTLCFLWIDLDPKLPDVCSDIMAVLKVDGMRVAPRVLMELDAKPAEATLAKLRAVKGVTDVRLVP